MKNLKLFSFISSIITFAICVVLTYVAYQFEIPTGTDGISLLVTAPLMIFVYIVLAGLLLSTIGTCISSIGSYVLAIKILSIMFLVLTIVLVGIDIYQFIEFSVLFKG